MRRPTMHGACHLALMIAYIVAALAYGVLMLDGMRGGHAATSSHAARAHAPLVGGVTPASGPVGDAVSGGDGADLH